jgi:redox-sensitive bicupin YhaK (pirin superfamily)
MSYGPLQAINETVVQPLQRSTTYGVRDVEIITYVIEGMVGHDNSLDDTAALPAGIAGRKQVVAVRVRIRCAD